MAWWPEDQDNHLGGSGSNLETVMGTLTGAGKVLGRTGRGEAVGVEASGCSTASVWA